MTSAEILQVHHISTESPSFLMHLVHCHTVFFMFSIRFWLKDKATRAPFLSILLWNTLLCFFLYHKQKKIWCPTQRF